MADLQQSQNQQFKTKFIYQMVDRTAMKIAVLIKISNLPYILNDVHVYDEISHPYVLHTPYGQLTKEYEIINYIINESKELSQKKIINNSRDHENKQDISIEQNKLEESNVIDLTGEDLYITVKMHEKLFQLRNQLFPFFHEFYKYLTGFEKTKKGKYDSLMNKIKKQIASLDSFISEYPELFEGQANFLTIIIACEMFMACKFVFEEKFRKSKYSLFNKFEKLSHKQEFKQIFGKSELCSKEYIPTEFEEDEMKNKRRQDILSPQIMKISETALSSFQVQSNRNELLYNYFKTTFSQQQNKQDYFPYFWMMYEDLNCILFQIFQTLEQNTYEFCLHRLRLIQNYLRKDLVSNLDYGMLGLYQQEKDKKYVIRGIICLGSKSYEDFQTSLFRNIESPQFKIHKIDASEQKQKKEVQNLWNHSIENTVKDDINLCSLMHI